MLTFVHLPLLLKASYQSNTIKCIKMFLMTQVYYEYRCKEWLKYKKSIYFMLPKNHLICVWASKKRKRNYPSVSESNRVQ